MFNLKQTLRNMGAKRIEVTVHRKQGNIKIEMLKSDNMMEVIAEHEIKTYEYLSVKECENTKVLNTD